VTSIALKIDRAVTKRIRKRLTSVATNIERETARALNRAATSTRAFYSKEVRKQVNVKAAVLKRGVKIRRANAKNQVAALDVSGQHVPLIAMGARQTKRGVTVKRYKAGRRILLKGAFITTMPKTGHVGVFRRKGAPRLPIQEQFGPSLINLWVTRDTPISLHAVTTLQKEMNARILRLRNRT